MGATRVPEYRTVREVMEALRWKSQDTVYRHIEAGDFPGARKRGGGWLIPEDDVTHYLEICRGNE